MGVLEIILLIAGAVIFILGFLLPAKDEHVNPHTKQLAKEEIKQMISDEMSGVKSHVEDVVDESIEYAMEKTERSLERLSNEKIMAVNEYSDTVLKEIHKNHEEVMFLYDMLNDKHINLKNTVSEVNQTVKVVEETKKEAEAVINSIAESQTAAEVITKAETIKRVAEESVAVSKKEDKQTVKAVSKAREKNNTVQEINITGNSSSDGGKNNNEQILALHKQGKSTVAIAKELGLGVGEVKLVIDLYKNI